MKRHFLKISLLGIVFFASVMSYALETITIDGIDVTEMTDNQVYQELVGQYYIYSPADEVNGVNFYSPDDGTVGMIIKTEEIKLVNSFAQTVFPADGSGNISGKITESASYYKGKWYKGSWSNKDLYIYKGGKRELVLMNFANTVWIGNETMVTNNKYRVISKDTDGIWYFNTNSDAYPFKKYGAAEIAAEKAKMEAEAAARQKEQQRELERQRKLEEERLKLEKQRQEEERIKREQREQQLRECYAQQRMKEEAKQRYNDSIQSGFIRGHECVDLGLSVVWASCNVGASQPEKNGYIGCDCDHQSNSNWSGGWREPTMEEVRELIKNCSFESIHIKGKRCLKVSSKINGNSIIIPQQAWGQKYYNTKIWTCTKAYGNLGYSILRWYDSLYHDNEVEISFQRCNEEGVLRYVLPIETR